MTPTYVNIMYPAAEGDRFEALQSTYVENKGEGCQENKSVLVCAYFI